MKNKTLLFIAHSCFWLLYLVIHTWVFANFLSLGKSFLRGIANGVPLMLLAYGNIWAINVFFEKKKIIKYIFFILILFLVIIPLRYFINQSFPSFEGILGDTNQENTQIISVIITNFLILVFSSFYQILVNRFEKTKKLTQEIQIHQAAQLQYLRSQINPHFLFNTLNNIYALALTKSDKTPQMVLKLSTLLRYVVYQEGSKTVKLASEIDLLNNYIDLYKLKSEKPPNISFTIQGEIENQEIEPMILIPIVENCFKHSDIEINTNGFIKIEVSVVDDELVFKTSNSKNDALTQKDDIGGVGLLNIKKRLELSLKGKYSLTINETKEIFTLLLKINFNSSI